MEQGGKDAAALQLSLPPQPSSSWTFAPPSQRSGVDEDAKSSVTPALFSYHVDNTDPMGDAGSGALQAIATVLPDKQLPLEVLLGPMIPSAEVDKLHERLSQLRIVLERYHRWVHALHQQVRCPLTILVP
jgi:hypothetical protein